MLRFPAILAICALPSFAAGQGVVANAIEGYKAVCLETAPDFSGYIATAKRAGFRKQGTSLVLADNSARIEIFATEQGCACLTTLIAPNPNATASSVLKATKASAAKVESHPNKQIAAVLVWKNGANALQLESDTRGTVPLVRATMLSRTACPKK